MASVKEIVKRRKSVSNICKITRTMEMIATARFKKAFDRAMGTKPYTEKLAHLVSTLAGGTDEIDHPLMRKNSESGKTLLLVLNSNRGLCGGYNGNIIRLAHNEIRSFSQDDRHFELRVSGKKGIQFFRFLGMELTAYTQFDEKCTYADVEVLADEFIEAYTARQIDVVRVVYTRFVSSARFYPEILTLLPLESLQTDELHHVSECKLEQYICSPPAEEILRELIPTTIRARLFQCFMDSIVSEQVARMRAMKAATDNAEQMIKALSRQYNRARQSQITNELLDIQGGVEALK